MNRTFVNLTMGLFCLWVMLFCGFWYFNEMTEAALFASLSQIIIMLMMFQPQTKDTETPMPDLKE